MKNLKWSLRAAKQFEVAIEYIRRNSDQNADKVKHQISVKIGQLTEGKVVHRKDPLRKNNDGSFRYFTIHNYRISYRETATDIIILRIRHESMEPQKY